MKTSRLIRATAAVLLILAILIVAGGVLLGEIAAHPWRLRTSHDTLGRVLASEMPLSRLENAQLTANDGVILQGTFAEPEKQNGSAVILLHGISDNRMGVSGFARLFLANGYRVLLVDSRGQGTSGGTFATYGVLERDDVHRWLDWLQNKQQGKCIYGFGESMGAAILLQALENESRFCAVVAESPFATLREAGYERIGRITRTGRLAPYLARPFSEVAYWYFRWRYGPDLNTANPIDTVTQSCTPILLIHGQQDRNIFPFNSEKILAASHGNAQVWRVAGAAHCGAWQTAPQEFPTRVLGWFATHQHPINSCGTVTSPAGS
jgi:dipeptidyl aminopeptidase/acylaminoacyl peptidase